MFALYILKFLIIFSTALSLANLSVLSFNCNNAFLIILFLKIGWISTAFFNVLLNAFFLMLSNGSFKLSFLFMINKSLNLLNIALFDALFILSIKYFPPNLILSNLSSPFFIFNLFSNSLSLFTLSWNLFHCFCIVLALSLKFNNLDKLFHFLNILHNLLLAILSFLLTKLANACLILSNRFFSFFARYPL